MPIVCAAKIQYRLEMGLSTVLTRDEVAYLALHVGRLVADIRNDDTTLLPWKGLT
jgi:beta-glucoside operon transcriptional antiterminator